ncbi:MAG: hypothetical protein ACK2TU_06835, partial [Anaerolineales bacterium]
MLFIISLLFSCQLPADHSESVIRKAIDNIVVINTHEHQRSPHELNTEKYNFYHLLEVSYLQADVRSAGAPGFGRDKLDSLDADDLWGGYGQGLDYSRTTSYYSHFIKGFQKLYGLEDLYFTKENVTWLSSQIEENYEDYAKWFGKAFKEAGFELMFNDQYWNPYNCDINRKYFALVFHINPLVMEVSNKPEPDAEKKNIYKQAEIDGFTINNLDDYLVYCEYLFTKNVEN